MSKTLTGLKALTFKNLQEWFLLHDEAMHISIDNKILQDDFLQQYQDPFGFVRLNLSPKALNESKLSNVELRLEMTFNGVPRKLYIDLAAVWAVYMPAEKNGKVSMMVFPDQSHFDFVDDKVNINKRIIETGKPKLSMMAYVDNTDSNKQQKPVNTVVDMAAFRNSKKDEVKKEN